MFKWNCPALSQILITWPNDKLNVYVESLKAFIYQDLQRSKVILVFDGYFPKNIKTFTWMQRAGSSCVCNLTPEMHPPTKQDILTNTKNKIQLNTMLTEGFLDSGYCTNATQKHTLIIAGISDVPMKIVSGVKINMYDLCSTHEEADILITQHAILSSLLGKSVLVVCDDSDVFCVFSN